MGMIQAQPAEPGQLVDIHHRKFVVTETQTSSLPPLLSGKGIERPMYLVSLSSMEEDAIGEELRVLWEIEPADAMDEYRQKSASYELVRTGPGPKGSVFRRMDQALFDVINEAHEELLLVTYVTYKVPELNEA